MATKAEELINDASCLSKAAADEPIFVLRAQDELAADIVREWCERAMAAGVPKAKVDEALLLARDMGRWGRENTTKLPD